MSDYSKTTNFTAKDSLATGDSNKLIKGAEHDTEYDAIAVAVATKHDSSDYASQAEAEAESSTSKIISPGRLAQWADYNGGMIGDIQALADPGADALLGWDDGAGVAIGFTLGDGLEFSGTTVRLEHLGIGDLEDAGADKILFWDDGASATAWLAATNGLSISGTNLSITDQSVSATVPVKLTNGTLGWDASSITELVGSGVSQSADGWLVNNAGVLNVVPYDQMAVLVKAGETTGTLAMADANTIMEFNATATLTIPLNASVAFEIGTIVLLVMDHASQALTVTAAASVTLGSIYHPGGTEAASDTVIAGGTACLIKIATDEWVLSGDIAT